MSKTLSLARVRKFTKEDKPHPGKQAMIDLTTSSIPTPVKRKFWIKLGGGLVLYEEDRLINSNGEWLTDLHIHAAQILLQQQFPEMSGLQCPLLSEPQTFAVQHGEFAQILNAARCHWVTVARIGCHDDEIQVYDSLYSSLPMGVKQCLAGIVFSSRSKLLLQYMNVQRQCNSSDCGLHAIATITALCNKLDPTQVTFDPKQLRHHFMDCLTKKHMTMFPILRKRCHNIVRIKTTEELPIYCTCRKPYTGTRMASCDICSNWFHQACLAIPDRVFEEKQNPWYCCN